MPTFPLGAPCWIDLSTSDLDTALAFYGGLFGWTAERGGPQYGGYVNFAKAGQRVAGAMANGGGAPDAWAVYLAVADAAATVDAAVAHGGSVVVPPMPVMDLGTMAYVADPSGAAVGVWQPGSHEGFGVLAEPDSPGWFELLSGDYERAVGFYRDVFGWDTHVESDTPKFSFTTLGPHDDARAGIEDAAASLPTGAGGEWVVYFRVADTDRTLARVAALGGTVIRPAEDTPYGRLGRVADPTGAAFRLIAAR